jgi:hypothetical protein
MKSVESTWGRSGEATGRGGESRVRHVTHLDTNHQSQSGLADRCRFDGLTRGLRD